MESKQRKEVCILAIICGKKILLETIQHAEGYEILSVPGGPIDSVSQRITEILGKEYIGAEKPFGSFIDLIIKPEGEVELAGSVFRIEVPDGYEITIPKGFDWYTKEQIEADARSKRDRRFYSRLLKERINFFEELSRDTGTKLYKFFLKASRETLLNRVRSRDAAYGNETNVERFDEVFKIVHDKDFDDFTVIETDALEIEDVADVIIKTIA